jgi:hypothetical protein
MTIEDRIIEMYLNDQTPQKIAYDLCLAPHKVWAFIRSYFNNDGLPDKWKGNKHRLKQLEDGMFFLIECVKSGVLDNKTKAEFNSLIDECVYYYSVVDINNNSFAIPQDFIDDLKKIMKPIFDNRITKQL